MRALENLFELEQYSVLWQYERHVGVYKFSSGPSWSSLPESTKILRCSIVLICKETIELK